MKNHNISYTKYCNQCKENLCIKCSKNHKNHDCIYFDELLPNEEDITNDIIQFKKYIEQFNYNIENIIIKIE